MIISPKIKIAVISFFSISLIGMFFYLKQPEPYFDVVRIEKYASGNAPCIPVLIGDQTITLLFDSGSQGHFFFTKEALEKIPEKSFLRLSKGYGFRGTVYENPTYSIPKASIGNFEFNTPEIEEESEEFEADSTLFKSENPSPREPGRIGWELYESLNLLLDIPHSQIGTCDSIETLRKHGYPVDQYIKIPLTTNSQMLGITVIGPTGPLNCLLDTGATFNIINKEGIDGAEVILKKAKIGNKEVGPLSFYAFPIRFPFQVDAILGMNFLSEHTVFIDFKKRVAYISV